MTENGFVILSVAFLVLVLCCIPLFWQLWRAAKNMATTLEDLNKNLPEILANLEEITTNINAASSIIKYEAESLSLLGDKVRTILQAGKNIENIILKGLSPPLWDTYKVVRGLLRGVTVFIEVFSNKRDGGPRGKG